MFNDGKYVIMCIENKYAFAIVSKKLLQKLEGLLRICQSNKQTFAFDETKKSVYKRVLIRIRITSVTKWYSVFEDRVDQMFCLF